jgi:redox-sensitive bicupin YhaK (pirin superfamily)
VESTRALLWENSQEKRLTRLWLIDAPAKERQQHEPAKAGIVYDPGREARQRRNPMITLRKSDERGRTRIDWLESYHSFSFGDYHDDRHMGFSDLRVINEDWVKPGAGFGMHPHRDMEILTVVLSGTLEHQDSMGNGSLIRPGDIQRMTAGTGVLHSEYNPSDSEPVHLLQIWIKPEAKGLQPGYEQKTLPAQEHPGQWRILASREGRSGSVKLNQDMTLLGASLPAGQQIGYPLKEGRHAWLQVASGQIRLNGQVLDAGDGAAITPESQEIDAREDQDDLLIEALDNSELLLFDLKAVAQSRVEAWSGKSMSSY